MQSIGGIDEGVNTASLNIIDEATWQASVVTKEARDSLICGFDCVVGYWPHALKNKLIYSP